MHTFTSQMSFREVLEGAGAPLVDLVRADVLASWATSQDLAGLVLLSSRVSRETWLKAVHTLQSKHTGRDWSSGDHDRLPALIDPVPLAWLLSDGTLGEFFVRRVLEASPLLTDATYLEEVVEHVDGPVGVDRLVKYAHPRTLATCAPLVARALELRPAGLLPELVAVHPGALPAERLYEFLAAENDELSAPAKNADFSHTLPAPHRWALLHADVVVQIVEMRSDVAELLSQSDEWLPVLARTSHWSQSLAERGVEVVRQHQGLASSRRGRNHPWHVMAFASAMLLNSGTGPEVRSDLLSMKKSGLLPSSTVTPSKEALHALDEGSVVGHLSALKDALADQKLSQHVGLRIHLLDQLAATDGHNFQRSVDLVDKMIQNSMVRGYSPTDRFSRGKDWRALPGFNTINLSLGTEHGFDGRHPVGLPLLQAFLNFREQLRAASSADAALAWQVLLDMEYRDIESVPQTLNAALAVADID